MRRYTDLVEMKHSALQSEEKQQQSKVEYLLQKIANSVASRAGLRRGLVRAREPALPKCVVAVFDDRDDAAVTLLAEAQKPFTIGRVGLGNDVEVRSEDAVGNSLASRLIAVAVPDPKERQLVLTDLGCLHGFAVVARQQPGEDWVAVEDMESKSGARRPLLVGMDERVLVDFRQAGFAIFNPPTCVECGRDTAVVRAPCGHARLCRACRDLRSPEVSGEHAAPCPLCACRVVF